MPSINYYRIQATSYKSICLFSASADVIKKHMTLDFGAGAGRRQATKKEDDEKHAPAPSPQGLVRRSLNEKYTAQSARTTTA
jgi:hypothetical protein